MKQKWLILIFFLNIANLFILYSSVDGRRIRIDRRQYFPPEPDFNFVDQSLVHRQGSLLPNIFSGPLALAAFLFTLPLIPSLIMAPFAVAGIPSAMSVLTTMVSSLTNGRPIQSFIDPLYSLGLSTSGGSGNQTGNSMPIRRQLNFMKTMAKSFRVAMNKRYSVTPNEPPPIPDALLQQDMQPQKLDMNEFEELLNGGNRTSNGNLGNSKNITSNLQTGGNNPLEDILSTATGGDLQKSIKGMDILYTSLRDIYSVIRNGLRRYEITDSECQSRIVCEIHQKIISRNKLLKTFSLNALDLLNLEKHIDSWNTLNQKSKESIKFYLNAAKVGFADKDCDREFRNCPTLNTRHNHHHHYHHLKNLILMNRNSLFNL